MKYKIAFFFLITFIGCFETSKKQQAISEDNQFSSNELTIESPEGLSEEEVEYWDLALRQELFYSLNALSDSVYISDRTQLEKIEGEDCTEKNVSFIYTTEEMNKIEILIEKGTFDFKKHNLNLVDTVFKNVNGEEKVESLIVKNIIDDRYSYGIDGNIPISEIKSLIIKWNGKPLDIPDTIYSNLYEPNFCRDRSTVEAYLSGGNNIYLYINCSDGAGGYSVKFIFDREKYLTKIISTNEMPNGFDFLDGTAKVN